MVSADRKSAFPPSGFQKEYPISSDCSTNAAHSELESTSAHTNASEPPGTSLRVAALSPISLEVETEGREGERESGEVASSATSISAPSVDLHLSTARMELRE
jgi:hypothetical protein